MNLQPYEQVLIDGGRRALLEFGSCKHCVVVDWRDDAEEILRDVKRMLPKVIWIIAESMTKRGRFSPTALCASWLHPTAQTPSHCSGPSIAHCCLSMRCGFSSRRWVTVTHCWYAQRNGGASSRRHMAHALANCSSLQTSESH